MHSGEMTNMRKMIPTDPVSLNSLVFPRWDAISIMFSVFLLTYTYIEARSNYYRGSILVLRSASVSLGQRRAC